MSQQVYHDGDFWYPLEAVAAGESPSTNPEKWQRLAIPADLVAAIASMATASLLPAEGRGEEAGPMHLAAQIKLNRAINEASLRDGFHHTLNVVAR